MGKFKVDKAILNGVHHFTKEEDYVAPPREVEQKLEWFRDQKLALMIHMGLYCQIGTVASWGLSDHDASWSRKDFEGEHLTGKEYRDMYFNLNQSFNPVRFDPEQWAQMAADNGFRYLIFTTKHHDGFCLWDTKETDYKTTAPACPYSQNKNADLVKSVFNAFRSKGLGIAAYFSKPDWHSEYYWEKESEGNGDTWRMTSYDPAEKPEVWEKFVKYTHNQLMELTTEYGNVDILWLDGGQVRPDTGLDIHLGEVIERIRTFQRDLIVADRTVGGKYENYVTPEQTVPEQAMSIPWESSISLGESYDYRYNDTYKDLSTVIRVLIEVVCKGGNLALNLSPQPDGRIPIQGLEVIKGLGNWLEKYGEAIYKTRICAPYKKGNIAFTKNNENIFAFFMTEKGVSYTEVLIPYKGEISAVTLMNTGKSAAFSIESEGIRVMLDEQQDEIALIFKMN